MQFKSKQQNKNPQEQKKISSQEGISLHTNGDQKFEVDVLNKEDNKWVHFTL